MNLRIIQHLNSQFQLVVEGVGQHQGVALVGFEQASWLSLDVDDIDEQIQFLQILLQRPVIVACPLQKNEVVSQRSQLAQALDEPTKACRGEQGNERTASVRWVDRSESVEAALTDCREVRVPILTDIPEDFISILPYKEGSIMRRFVALFARIALLVLWLSTSLINRAFHGGCDSATAGDPPPANYHPDLRPWSIRPLEV